MWFRKTPPPAARVLICNGLHVGQLVQHKVTGAKAVIVAFTVEGQFGLPDATVTTGWPAEDEFTTRVAEIEPYVRTEPNG